MPADIKSSVTELPRWRPRLDNRYQLDSACVLCKRVLPVAITVPDGVLLTGGVVAVPVLCDNCGDPQEAGD